VELSLIKLPYAQRPPLPKAAGAIANGVRVSSDSELVEAWLHESPEAMASLVHGIGEAERGEAVSRGSFAKDLT